MKNVKNKIKTVLLAMRMEYHWRAVMGCRRAGNRRLDRGERCSSGALVRLSVRIDGHCCALIRLQEEFGRRSA